MKSTIKYTFSLRYHYAKRLINSPFGFLFRIYLINLFLPLAVNRTLYIPNIIAVILLFLPQPLALIIAGFNHLLHRRDPQFEVQFNNKSYVLFTPHSSHYYFWKSLKFYQEDKYFFYFFFPLISRPLTIPKAYIKKQQTLTLYRILTKHGLKKIRRPWLRLFFYLAMAANIYFRYLRILPPVAL